ncbi:MAG TPA: DNA-processing protein DprA [Polyangiaceae bacterium]|nr:DNA-processing protein DprA [Polyangiaceae bacterium]
MVLLGSTLPPRLKDLPNPPKCLFVRGELPRGPSVAIVGTRHPTAEGSEFAHSLAGELARSGVAILSGGAEGIDTVAHEGALSVGGETAVIAPAGFSRPFPEDNAALFARVVAEGGAYASLVEDEVPARQGAFFARNACLAALGWALVVVEAGFRSGARNAAAAARRLGRPVFAVPSAPWLPKGAGCIEELRLGARICAGAKDVLRSLEELGAQPIPPSSKPRGRRRSPAPGELQLPLSVGSFSACCPTAALAEQTATPDVTSPPSSGDGEAELCERVTLAIAAGAHEPGEVAELAGLSVAVVNRILLTLRLQGVLVSAASGYIYLLKSSD